MLLHHCNYIIYSIQFTVTLRPQHSNFLIKKKNKKKLKLQWQFGLVVMAWKPHNVVGCMAVGCEYVMTKLF